MYTHNTQVTNVLFKGKNAAVILRHFLKTHQEEKCVGEKMKERGKGLANDVEWSKQIYNNICASP